MTGAVVISYSAPAPTDPRIRAGHDGRLGWLAMAEEEPVLAEAMANAAAAVVPKTTHSRLRHYADQHDSSRPSWRNGSCDDDDIRVGTTFLASLY